MVGVAPVAPSSRSSSPELRYSVGVGVTVAAILSPYFLPPLVPATDLVYRTLAGDVTVVYGIPIAAFALLIGAGPLRRWSADARRAVPVGLGWFGAMTILGLVVTVVLGAFYQVYDPGALRLLEKPNPALQAAAGDPWLFVAFAFVAGAAEEAIFRGWIFGFWTGRTTSWLVPALGSSALFAALHLYYGTTYGIASPLIFPSLFLVGFGFAATYRSTGGNLVVPSALHGAYDATGYLTLVSLAAGEGLRALLIIVSALVGLVYYLSRTDLGVGDRPPAGPPPS